MAAHGYLLSNADQSKTFDTTCYRDTDYLFWGLNVSQGTILEKEAH